MGGPSSAQPQAARPGEYGDKRIALVIGNSAYRNVPALRNPANDARLMAKTLKDTGFTLVGGDALIDLDRASMSRAVMRFGQAVGAAGVALFYYSGHGMQVDGKNWLVPVDANPVRRQDLDFQMVDADLVLKQLGDTVTRLNLILLDACRNNPFGDRGLRALDNQGLAEMRAPTGTLISYATSPAAVASDGDGPDSPYTMALTEAIREPGADVLHVFNEVGLKVWRMTGGAQQPWLASSPITGVFYFTSPKPSPPPVQGGPPNISVAMGPPVLQSSELRLSAPPECTVLLGRAAGDHTDLVGFAGNGPAWRSFVREQPNFENRKVLMLPAYACTALDVMRDALMTRLAGGGKAFLAVPDVKVVAGATLQVLLPGVGQNTIRLDIWTRDGSVRHVMAVPKVDQNGDGQAAIAVPAGVPPGEAVLAAILTVQPLPPGQRGEAEPAAAYLDALRRVIPPTARADMAVIEVAPPVQRPTPPPARPPKADGRCASVLERASIGAPLSEADRAFLRSNC